MIVVNYCFPKQWPEDRELRTSIIGECYKLRHAFWLTELFTRDSR